MQEPPSSAPEPPDTLAGAQQGARPDQAEEDLWGALLDYVADGSVLPVVGRDLLVVKTPDASGEPVEALLYSLIAQELAIDLKVDIDEAVLRGPNPLGAVASEYILGRHSPADIYRRLPAVLSRVDSRRADVLPEPLCKLAAINGFRIMLTTTFDNLLADSVAWARQAPPDVLSYVPRPSAAARRTAEEAGLLTLDTLRVDELDRGQAPPIVHILGRISNSPNYVVTEEDAFEFIFSLQETKPQGLIDLLRTMKLLIVGCRFPSWLVRYFLRATRGRRLLDSPFEQPTFVVDPTAAEDASLVQFLRTFRTQTELFTRYGPTQFVDELHRRWSLRAGHEAATDPFSARSVFVGYASEDAAAAIRIADAISRVPLPVWLDRQQIRSGDAWEGKLKRNIQSAAAFVPILSQHCKAPGEREFRREWKHALHKQEGMPADQPFICPLVIDDLSRSNEKIDAGLRALQWSTPETDGSLSLEFVERLRDAHKAAQVDQRFGR